MSGPAVCRYVPDDRDAAWDIHTRALLAVDAHGGYGSRDDDVRHVERDYLNAEGEFLVALLGDVIVATGGIRRAEGDTGELKRMRVEPAFQRRSFGRATVDALDGRARDLGLSRL